MGVDRGGHVFRHGAHFDCQHAFGDQFARAGAADADTEDAARLRIQHQFRQAVVAAQRRGSSRCGPGKSGDRHVLAGGFGRLFGESAPGDFRVRKDDGRNRRIERRLLPGDDPGGDQPFMRSFVREHGFADHIADMALAMI